MALAVAACGSETPVPAPPAAPSVTPRVTNLEIVPASAAFAAPGETLQVTVRASFSDGTQRDVTRETTWAVIDERVATISTTGLVTAREYGSTGMFGRWQQQNSISMGIEVSRRNGPLWTVVGVVRDARSGLPIVNAEVRIVGGAFADARSTVTDGNGYFDLGALGGPTTLRVSKLGYEYGSLSTDVSGEGRVEIGLTPNPGAYIERTFVDRLAETDAGVKDYRIVTRDGVIDATAENLTCDYNGYDKLQMELRSGSLVLDADLRPQTCAPRVRTTVPRGEYLLRVKGHAAGGDFRVTFREPR
jgi:hypothetical protein